MEEIELLYFDDCPSWQQAYKNLKDALEALGNSQSVTLIQVETNDEARAAHFTGSPTIRVDGKDIFPPGHEDYALGCRLYETPEGMRGWPTQEMIAAALRARK